MHLTWASVVILPDARLVQKACDEIMGSSRLRKVLGVILNLGNRLNAAGSVKKDPALAIILESLLKLNQPRAFDKKTTFLHYVIKCLRRNDATLCHFKDDLTTVFVAEKLVWDHTLAELKRIESQLESVRRLALYHGSDKDWLLTSNRDSVGDDSATVLSIPTITVEQEINVLKRSSIGNFTLDMYGRYR
jgi:Formin Homology 2 Domain